MASLKPNFRQTIFILLLCASFGIAAGQSPPKNDWKGKFEHEAYLGRTTGGTAIVISYAIEVKSVDTPLGAMIKADGYMIDDEVRGDTKTDNNRINMFFNSYPNGSTKNQFDVELYKKGDLLLSLEKITSKQGIRYLVSWGKYNTELKKKAEVFGTRVEI